MSLKSEISAILAELNAAYSKGRSLEAEVAAALIAHKWMFGGVLLIGVTIGRLI